MVSIEIMPDFFCYFIKIPNSFKRYSLSIAINKTPQNFVLYIYLLFLMTLRAAWVVFFSWFIWISSCACMQLVVGLGADLSWSLLCVSLSLSHLLFLGTSWQGGQRAVLQMGKRWNCKILGDISSKTYNVTCTSLLGKSSYNDRPDLRSREIGLTYLWEGLQRKCGCFQCTPAN